jgi:GNAT superfamily N-acetyltransferase
LSHEPQAPQADDPARPPGLRANRGIRTATVADRQPLAELLIAAYAGTVDDGGETSEEALAEIDRTLGGAYGPFLAPCSFLVERNGTLLAASLLTRWQEAPLVAFVMVAPHAQRQGLAEQTLRCSMAALWEQGETTLPCS